MLCNVHNAFFGIPQNNPTSRANPPEHEPRADNGTKTPGNEFSGTTLRYKGYLQGERATKQSKGR